jgi:hypothetical protein
LTGYLDNKVVVPFGHNQLMEKETLWKNMLQEKEVNGHTSLSPLRNTGSRKTENWRTGYSGN